MDRLVTDYQANGLGLGVRYIPLVHHTIGLMGYNGLYGNRLLD